MRILPTMKSPGLLEPLRRLAHQEPHERLRPLDALEERRFLFSGGRASRDVQKWIKEPRTRNAAASFCTFATTFAPSRAGRAGVGEGPSDHQVFAVLDQARSASD